MYKIDLMCEAVNRVGVCRVQDEKLRIVFLMPEGLAKDFRTKRRAAHAAEHHVFELARASYAICKRDKVIFNAYHCVRHCKPAKRVLDNLLVSLFLFPERCVLAPDAPHHLIFLSLLDCSSNRISILAERSL